MTEFRIILIDENNNHILDKTVDSIDFVLSGGVFALYSKDPFLIKGLAIEPNPRQKKIGFRDLTEEEKDNSALVVAQQQIISFARTLLKAGNYMDFRGKIKVILEELGVKEVDLLLVEKIEADY